MLFDKCKTSTKQGDLGEARAIYEYAKMGYGVSRTLFDSEKYDLIVDDGSSLQRVQVRTTSVRTNSGTGYHVSLTTTGGNTKSNTIRKFNANEYDLLFVLTNDNRCWSIPVNEIKGRTMTVVGSTGPGSLYHEYELNRESAYIPPQSHAKLLTIDESVILNAARNVSTYTDLMQALDVYNSTDNINRLRTILHKHGMQYKSDLVDRTGKKQTCEHFSKEQLQQMVWEMPLTKIGEKVGISDNAIRRWVKKWNVTVPPRGHFIKKEQTGQVNTYLKTNR